MTQQPDPLQDITARLKLYYDQWKSGEKDKDKVKKEFFEEISKRVSCDERLVSVLALTEDEAREKIAKSHPLWNIDDMRVIGEADHVGGPKIFEVIIIENPEYKKYTYFNPANKLIYERQLAVGAPSLDDERLKAVDPRLYERVTYVPEPERQLRPLEDLSDEDLAALQDYIYEGKPSVRLAAPRKATEEELSELE